MDNEGIPTKNHLKNKLFPNQQYPVNKIYIYVCVYIYIYIYINQICCIHLKQAQSHSKILQATTISCQSSTDGGRRHKSPGSEKGLGDSWY